MGQEGNFCLKPKPNTGTIKNAALKDKRIKNASHPQGKKQPIYVVS